MSTDINVRHFIFFGLFLWQFCIFSSCSHLKKNSAQHHTLQERTSKALTALSEFINQNTTTSIKVIFRNHEVIMSSMERTITISKAQFLHLLAASLYVPTISNDLMAKRIKDYKKPYPASEEQLNEAHLHLLATADFFSVPLKKAKGTSLKRGDEIAFNRLVDEVINKIGQISQYQSESVLQFWKLRTIANVLLLSYNFESEYIKVPTGNFIMGSPVHERHRNDDEASHKVAITKPFEIQQTAVTQAQYFMTLGYNPSSFSQPEYCPETFVKVSGVSLCPIHPVENVSWLDVQVFLSILNRNPAIVFSLPTEAEREYFTRAGTQSAFFFGNDFSQISDFGWWIGNSPKGSHQVASKNPNSWGLFDVHGNVWELTTDYYAPYKLQSEPQIDPTGPIDGTLRVMRGGSWGAVGISALRSARRYYTNENFRGYMVGFRIKKTIIDY